MSKNFYKICYPDFGVKNINPKIPWIANQVQPNALLQAHVYIHNEGEPVNLTEGPTWGFDFTYQLSGWSTEEKDMGYEQISESYLRDLKRKMLTVFISDGETGDYIANATGGLIKFLEVDENAEVKYSLLYSEQV